MSISEEAVQLLARESELSASHEEEDARVIFRLRVKKVPLELLGSRLRLTIGPLTIMAIDLPSAAPQADLLFGPTSLPIARLMRSSTFVIKLTLDGPERRTAVIACGSGAPLDVILFSNAADYFRKVQLHGTRYKHPDLLTMGARAAFSHFQEVHLRASALTIQAHRVLDKDFSTLDEEDRLTINEVLGFADPVCAEASAEISQSEAPPWDLVRWTVSLATVCGNLALMKDDLVVAARFFAVAAENSRHVAISHVSALNVINGCFFSGLLEAMLGNRSTAGERLLEGIVRFKDAVAPQKLTANVWVIGDLINAAQASRQCFIARVRLGLWETDATALVDPGSVPILAGLKSPVARIVDAGLAPDFANRFSRIGRVWR